MVPNTRPSPYLDWGIYSIWVMDFYGLGVRLGNNVNSFSSDRSVIINSSKIKNTFTKY